MLAVITVSVVTSIFAPTVNVQTISTEITYRDGKIETQQGLGFVVGRQFVTVNHNIAPRRSSIGVKMRRTYLNSLLVHPVFTHPAHDIAVFDIPPELCPAWCDADGGTTGARSAAREISWPSPGNEVWSTAMAKEVVIKGPQTAMFGSCRDNVVIEVDAPFYSGSSGGPVVDNRSGEAIGVVQGSFAYDDGRAFGYFKPLRCVYELMGAAPEEPANLVYGR